MKSWTPRKGGGGKGSPLADQARVETVACTIVQSSSTRPATFRSSRFTRRSSLLSEINSRGTSSSLKPKPRSLSCLTMYLSDNSCRSVFSKAFSHFLHIDFNRSPEPLRFLKSILGSICLHELQDLCVLSSNTLNLCLAAKAEFSLAKHPQLRELPRRREHCATNLLSPQSHLQNHRRGPLDDFSD